MLLNFFNNFGIFINRFGMDDFSKLKYDEWYE